jgi:hypothetical protein
MPRMTGQLPALDQALRIFESRDAASLASELFQECFKAPFPVPRDNCGLSIPTPPEAWHQYVARYTWPEGREETVGFCNWIRYRDVYLEGGMCVSPTIYRRLPKEHFAAIRARGGIAQMLMEKAATELNDGSAWFGFCGDAKALAVDLRAGYELTDHRYLIVKWFKPLPEPERRRLIDSIARIGPF